MYPQAQIQSNLLYNVRLTINISNIGTTQPQIKPIPFSTPQCLQALSFL